MVTNKVAIFDLDGTLADTYPWFISVINEVADRYSFKTVDSNDEADGLRGLPAKEIIRKLGIPRWKLPLVVNHMRMRMKADISNIELFEGVEDFLRKASDSGYKIALVSSNSNENINLLLGKSAQYFCCIEGGVSMFGKYRKITKVLRKTGANVTTSFYVGDEVRDIHCAKRAGIQSIAVSWGYNTENALRQAHPEHLVTSFQDLILTLKKA
jgi:phosphoglycolate phosphatase